MSVGISDIRFVLYVAIFVIRTHALFPYIILCVNLEIMNFNELMCALAGEDDP